MSLSLIAETQDLDWLLSQDRWTLVAEGSLPAATIFSVSTILALILADLLVEIADPYASKYYPKAVILTLLFALLAIGINIIAFYYLFEPFWRFLN